MPVITLDIHDAEELNGTPLGTLTDEDVKAFSIRVTRAKYGNGGGKIVISRHHPSADLLMPGNLVRVYIPVIAAENCIFAFFLQEDETVLLAGQPDRASEDITMGGPGAFDVLRYALLDAHQQGSGSFAPSDGQWRDTDSKYTDLLDQMLDEDNANPVPALGAVTWDFTPTLDSDGNPSPQMYNEFALPIGTDYANAFRRLAQTDEDFELYMNPGSSGAPQLLLQCFGSFSTYEIDRSSPTYAADKVRFTAPGNLLTELKRNGRGTKRGSHALVGGKDGAYRMVERADWVISEPVRRIFVSAPETNSQIVMERIGQRALNERVNQQDLVDLEFAPGDDELNGLYLPHKHFKPADIVTLDTGSGFKDLVNRSMVVQAYRIALHVATDDTNATTAHRSLKCAVELGNTVAGVSTMGVDCCEAPGSQTPGIVLCQPASPPELIAFGNHGEEATEDITSSSPPGFDLPPGWLENDIFLLWHVSAESADTPPAGWTGIVTGVGGGGLFHIGLSWRRATASESVPTVATNDGGNHMAVIAAIRGCPTTGDPWDAMAWGIGANDTSISVPGDTTTVSNCLVFTAVGIRGSLEYPASNASGWTNSALEGLTEVYDRGTPVGLDPGLMMAAGVKSAAGNYGTTTATLASAHQDNAISVALLPALTGDEESGSPCSDSEQFTGTCGSAARCDHQHHAEHVILSDGTTVQDAIDGAGTSGATILAAKVTDATFTPGSGAATAISFDTEVRDDGGFFDAGAPTRLTVPSTGWYAISGNCTTVGTTSQDSLILYIREGGATTLAANRDYETTNGIGRYLNISAITYLTATDYVELVIEFAAEAVSSIFSIARVGTT